MNDPRTISRCMLMLMHVEGLVVIVLGSYISHMGFVVRGHAPSVFVVWGYTHLVRMAWDYICKYGVDGSGV